MEPQEIALCMANGSATYIDRKEEAGDIEWMEHPKFAGVFLKHLVKGADTNDKLSCHMVKVAPNCVLDNHVHENQWELHEVIEGEGEFVLDTKKSGYYPGRMALIPRGIDHKVIAGDDGLVLLAKFFPALC